MLCREWPESPAAFGAFNLRVNDYAVSKESMEGVHVQFPPRAGVLAFVTFREPVAELRFRIIGVVAEPLIKERAHTVPCWPVYTVQELVDAFGESYWTGIGSISLIE
jgi:hypothetical protein